MVGADATMIVKPDMIYPSEMKRPAGCSGTRCALCLLTLILPGYR